MITAEIKIHPEPTPTVVVAPTTNNYSGYPKTTTNNVIPFAHAGMYCSQFELNNEQARAFNNGIRIGNEYKLKNSFVTVKVIAWNIVAGKHEIIDGKPAIIKGQRCSPVDPTNKPEFNYTVDEILEMEEVHV